MSSSAFINKSHLLARLLKAWEASRREFWREQVPGMPVPIYHQTNRGRIGFPRRGSASKEWFHGSLRHHVATFFQHRGARTIPIQSVKRIFHYWCHIVWVRLQRSMKLTKTNFWSQYLKCSQANKIFVVSNIISSNENNIWKFESTIN